MLGSTEEPPPSPPPAHAPDIGLHLRPPAVVVTAPPSAPDQAPPSPSPPLAATAPPPPRAYVPVPAAAVIHISCGKYGKYHYKFKFLEFCLKAGFESEAGKCLAKVKKTFKDLFVEYSSHDGDSMEYDEGDKSAAASIDNPWAQWKERTKEQQKQRAKMSELDIYLKDEICQQEDDFDILYWWSTNAQKYPVLSRIAKDVLAAPVSSVASESAFSTGGRVLSDYRSRLLGSTIEALICLQDWMRPRGKSRVNTVSNDLIYAKHNIDGRDTDIFGD